MPLKATTIFTKSCTLYTKSALFIAHLPSIFLVSLLSRPERQGSYSTSEKSVEIKYWKKRFHFGDEKTKGRYGSFIPADACVLRNVNVYQFSSRWKDRPLEMNRNCSQVEYHLLISFVLTEQLDPTCKHQIQCQTL